MSRFIVIVVLWLGVTWGVIGALLAPVLPGGWLTVSALIVISLAPLAVFALTRGRAFYPGALYRLAVMRPFWYLQLFLPLLAAAGILGVAAGAVAGAPGVGGRWALLVMAVAFATVMGAGWVGSRRLRVVRLTASWPTLPPGLDGFRIVQISDTHIGPHSSRRYLRRVARTVSAASPELIAVTGDLIDDYAPDVASYARSLGRLTAPLGVFAIPGNHDVYAGWLDVRRRLDDLALTVLVNDSRIIERGGSRLAIVGTGDPAGRGDPSSGAAPDLDRALAGVPDDAFVVALAHNPALWPGLAEHGVPLTLSGHTHWGQFALPGRGWSLATPFLERAMGAHQSGESLLYIHPGTGFWGIPFRLGARPQVAVIELRRGETGIIER